MRWLVAVLVAVLLAMVAGPARAAASRVALVRQAAPPPEIAEATTRVRAELEAAGFEVVVFEARGSDPPAQVAGAQLSPPPFAIVALVSTEAGAAADVWIDRSLAGEGSKRRVEVEDTSGGTASALAVRAMELLRAALLEETGKPRPRPAPVPEDVARWLAAAGAPANAPPVTRPPPAPASAPAKARPTAPAAARSSSSAASGPPLPPLLSSISIEGGMAWLQSFGGFGAAFGPSLRLTLPVAPRTALRASLLAPAITSEVEAAASASGGAPTLRAGLRQELLLVEATRALADGTLVPLVSAGVGGYHLLAEGRAEAGYSASALHALALAVGGGAGAAVRLGPRASLLLDARGVVLLPAPVVKFVDAEVARAGPAMLLVSLGIVASL